MDERERLREEMRDRAADEYAAGRLSEEEMERTFGEIARIDSPEEAELCGLGRFLPAVIETRPLVKSEPPASFGIIGDQSHYVCGEQRSLSATLLLGDLKVDCLRATAPEIELDLMNLLGDIILRVPYDYRVENRMTIVLGECKDRDLMPECLNPAKRIVLTGFHLLGDIKIKRY